MSSNSTDAQDAPRPLIVIHYPVDVGFAIGRLVAVFHRMANAIAAHPGDVHFSFSDLRSGRCDMLPADFRNYLRFEPRTRDPHAIRRLTDYVRDNGVNLLFGFDMPVEASYLAVARQAGVRAVVSYFGAPLSSLLPWPLLQLKRAEVRWFRPHKPDLFIVESQAMLRTAVAGRGIPRPMIRVVPTGADVGRFKPLPEARPFAYRHFGIPADRQIVVFMGHFHRRKGVHVLLRAARHMVTVMRRSDVHFLFLGSRDPDVQAVRDAEDFEDVADFVCLGGYQDRVPEILAGCAVGCVPTTGWDSFPLSPLEMQACGLPVVVSDCQGLPESVVDGVTGLIVPAGDHERLASALLSLVDDAGRRSTMGIAARARIVQEFSVDLQVARLSHAVREAWERTA